MNRIEFMTKLEMLLKDISVEEREEALAYYRDYFEDAGEENEGHVISELGSPEKVARTIKAGLKGQDDDSSEYSETGYTDTRFEEKESPATRDNQMGIAEPPRTSRLLKIILIIAIIIVGAPIVLPLVGGLLAAVLGILVGILALFLGLLVAAVAVGVSGIVAFIAGIIGMFTSLPAGLFAVGIGLILLVLGVVGTVVMVKLCMIAFPAMFRGLVGMCRKLVHKKEAV